MADAYEQNLAQKTDLTISDYIRVVGTDNNSYKQPMADVAQKIVEDYAGSTLAGSAQSVKSAIDGLKSTATADKAELESDINTVASNLATETSTRTSQDTNLQAQINQLVAPTGTAPNPAEIENARIGADNVTYTTLGDAIRTQVTDLKNELNELDSEIGVQKFVGISGYVSIPCKIVSGKTYYVQKYSGQCGIATRATSGGSNIDTVVPAGTLETYFASFTATADANYLRVTADSASTFSIFDSEELEWKGMMFSYESGYSFESTAHNRGIMYPFRSGERYRINTSGEVYSLFTKDFNDTSEASIIDTIIRDTADNPLNITFVASQDAKFLRISGQGSISGYVQRIDGLEEIVPLFETYSLSDFTSNKYYDLPTIGEATDTTPKGSSVGNATLEIQMKSGETIILKTRTADETRSFGFVNESNILLERFDDCLNGMTYTANADGKALITTYPTTFGGVVIYREKIGKTIQNGLTEDIYAPYPQLSANGADDSDFDSETATTADIYTYIDGIMNKYPQLIDKTVMGKDATNTYDVNRYVIADKQLNDYVATIFIGANEHGPSSDPRECAIVVCRFIKDLCEANAKTNKMLNIIKKYCRVVVIPVSNPYGFNNNSRNNGNNVNINRNYDTPGWASQTDTDKGASAGSEVETQYIMNTVTAFNPDVALDLHCLGYVNSANDKKCHYEGHINNSYKINEIARSMKRDYDLTCTSYGIGDYTTSATGDSYFNYKGIKGLLLEFNARDGVSGGSDNLHTANIMEANYTFMLRIINMLMSDFDESLDASLFR